MLHRILNLIWKRYTSLYYRSIQHLVCDYEEERVSQSMALMALCFKRPNRLPHSQHVLLELYYFKVARSYDITFMLRFARLLVSFKVFSFSL